MTLLAEIWKPDQKIIGENIRKARKAAKLTQEELAEEMGGSCSNKVISRYEKGAGCRVDQHMEYGQAPAPAVRPALADDKDKEPG